MASQLRFNNAEIRDIASRYNYTVSEVEIEKIKPRVMERGFLKKSELEKVTYWKSPRSAGHARKNTEEYVKETTRFAFGTGCERAKVESLTIMDGVSWPTASVILHFFHRDPYPIMDYRALWSISVDAPSQYNFDFWWRFVIFCRETANRAGVDMRTLDKALWQYSKENQKK